MMYTYDESNDFKDEYDDKGVLTNYVIIEVIEEINDKINKYKLRFLCHNEIEANNKYGKLKQIYSNKLLSNKLLLIKNFKPIFSKFQII